MKLLVKANLECSIGGHCFGVLFYADDVVLLSDSVIKMQNMLNICSLYGKQCGINFNPSEGKY